MKKLVSLALALILALSVCSALADITPSQVVGAWYLQSRAQYGAEYFLDGDYRIEFNRDKTVLIVMDGVERIFNWEISEDQIHLGVPEGADYEVPCYYMNFTDGEVILETVKDFSVQDSGYFTFTFGREAVTITLPSFEHEATSEEDFYGDYDVTMIYTPASKTYEMAEKGWGHVAISFAEANITMGEKSAVIMTDYQDGKLLLDASKLLGEQYKNLSVSISLDESIIKVSVMDDSNNETTAIYLNKTVEGE